MWWEHTCEAVRIAASSLSGIPEVAAIGISYQMHGLVLLDKSMKLLRPSIIWCDSRAVPYGEKAFQALGVNYCLSHLLNSPGNFTAAKLAWVKDKEPSTFGRIAYVCLPGDFIAYKMTGEVCTTDTGLSEGIFWDFREGAVSQRLMGHFGFSHSLLPPSRPVFSVQGNLVKQAAAELGVAPGAPVSYRAGDQPNNALSLNVLRPGETAATAGTSGVIYSVTDKNAFDPLSRVNTFLHVNNNKESPRNGVLLCVNGTGISNAWMRRNITAGDPYDKMNALARQAPAGADGLRFFPFGNGSERILANRKPGASLRGLDFNRHNRAHVLRATQEGIVFALRYGFDILREIDVDVAVIRAGMSNMFLSPLFREAFSDTVGLPLELYDTNGAVGAALGAGLGAGIFAGEQEAFSRLQRVLALQPSRRDQYEQVYQDWKRQLQTLNS
jgi:xylulokinase